MSKFRVLDGAAAGNLRVSADSIGTIAAGVAGPVQSSPVLSEAWAKQYCGYTPTEGAVAGGALPANTVLFMPLVADLSVVTPAGRPLTASTPFVAGSVAPNGKGSARIGPVGGCGWRMAADGISDIGMGDFTMSWWARVPAGAANAYSSILTTQAAAPYHWTLQYYRYQAGSIYIAGPAGDVYLCSLAGKYDAWHHWAWTKKAGVSRFFIDGIKVSEFGMADFNSATNVVESGLWSLMAEAIDTQQLLLVKAALWDADFTPPDYL